MASRRLRDCVQPEPALAAHAITSLIEEHRPPAMRADLLWITSMLQLASGQVAAAHASRALAAEQEADVAAERRRFAFDDIAEWYAASLPLPYADSMLARVRRSAEQANAVTDPLTPVFASAVVVGEPLRVEPLRQYTIGLTSLRLRDIASAKTAAEALRRVAVGPDANVLVRDLDRGLRAAIAAFDGRREEALDLLATLGLRDTQGDITVTPFASRAHERFLHGELLVTLGRDQEALNWFASLGTGSVTEIPLKALSHLRQAEIHERHGKTPTKRRNTIRGLSACGARPIHSSNRWLTQRASG